MLWSVTVSGVSSAAAMHGSAEFLAPLMETRPCSGRPPEIRNLSTMRDRVNESRGFSQTNADLICVHRRNPRLITAPLFVIRLLLQMHAAVRGRRSNSRTTGAEVESDLLREPTLHRHRKINNYSTV